MSLIDDETAVELIGEMKAARSAAHEMAAEHLARGRERLRSTTKTRKSARTRKRIMHAASDLMVERGNTNFQMSEVSERCQLSKGSLYYYFADKDELISAIFDDSVGDLVDGIEHVVAQSESARDALQRLFSEFARRLRAGSPLALAMTYELAGSSGASMSEVTSRFVRAAQLIAEQVERGKAEGIVRHDVDSNAAAVFATGGFVATSLVVASRQMGENADALTASLVDVTLRGVGVEGVSFA